VQSGLPQKMFQINNWRAFRPQNRKSIPRIKSKDMRRHAQAPRQYALKPHPIGPIVRPADQMTVSSDSPELR
jgi:hypothetical protein